MSSLGKVAKIDVCLTEITEPDETVTASGLVVVESDAPAKSRFKAFVANPEEILAIERIARSVHLVPGDTAYLPGASQYL